MAPQPTRVLAHHAPWSASLAILHLISGLPGAGKTTYARALEARLDAVRFTLDVWLLTAYGEYAIDAVGHAEHLRRVQACRELIRTGAAPLLQRGVDVILDDGFFLRLHRGEHVAWARALGAQAHIHFLDAAHDLLLARTRERNARLPSHHFHISPDRLAAFRALYEPPSVDESDRLVRVDAARATDPDA